MTVKEVAARLEISTSLAYALIEEGRLRCVRIGRRGRRGKIIVRQQDVDEFLQAHAEATRAELED